MWLNTHELQAKRDRNPKGFLEMNPSFPYWIGHDCMTSQSFRRGQPAATQARSSSVRQSVDRPMWIGCGILPAASQDRQVRSDRPHIRAASRAVKRNGIVFCTAVVDDNSGSGLVVSLGIAIDPHFHNTLP